MGIVLVTIAIFALVVLSMSIGFTAVLLMAAVIYAVGFSTMPAQQDTPAT